jgi:hypothetical protein
MAWSASHQIREALMYTLEFSINSVPQMPASGYHDRNDALRRANQLWGIRFEMCRELGIGAQQCRVEFKVVGDDGSVLGHWDILDEIGRRADLKIPPKVY